MFKLFVLLGGTWSDLDRIFMITILLRIRCLHLVVWMMFLRMDSVKLRVGAGAVSRKSLTLSHNDGLGIFSWY